MVGEKHCFERRTARRRAHRRPGDASDIDLAGQQSRHDDAGTHLNPLDVEIFLGEHTGAHTDVERQITEVSGRERDAKQLGAKVSRGAEHYCREKGDE